MAHKLLTKFESPVFFLQICIKYMQVYGLNVFIHIYTCAYVAIFLVGVITFNSWID